jgi:hypothetical protein
MLLKKEFFRRVAARYKLLPPVIAVFLLQAVNPAAAQTISQLRDGVVVNAGRNEVYITTPDNKVQALTISTGLPLWTSATKARPLAVVNGKLVSQENIMAADNKLSIIELDINRKGRPSPGYQVNLPASIKTNMLQTAENNFTLSTRVFNNNTYLYWQYSSRPLRGLLDSADMTGLNRGYIDTGIFRLNKSTGKFISLNNAQIPSGFRAEGSILYSPVNENLTDKGRRFVSADGKHNMVSVKIAGDSIFMNYRWEIYEQSSGNKIGELMDYRSYTPFVVAGNILLYEKGPYIINTKNGITEVPLQLVAVDIRSSNEVWKTSIYDFIYRGPDPSSPGD